MSKTVDRLQAVVEGRTGNGVSSWRQFERLALGTYPEALAVVRAAADVRTHGTVESFRRLYASLDAFDEAATRSLP